MIATVYSRLGRRRPPAWTMMEWAYSAYWKLLLYEAFPHKHLPTLEQVEQAWVDKVERQAGEV